MAVTNLASPRLSKYRRLLEEEKVDALLIANYSAGGGSLDFDYNLFYLSNLYQRYDNSYLILTEKDVHVCIDNLEVARARSDEGWLEGIEGAPLLGRPPQETADRIMQAVKGRVSRSRPRLGVNGRKLPASFAIALASQADLVDISLPMEKSRLVKDQIEIDLISRACRIAEAGIRATIASAREGVTERELAALAEAEMVRQGATYFWAYPLWVVSGPDGIGIVGTPSPSDRQLVKGDLVWLDIPPAYRGYMADIAATLVVGEPTKKQMEVMDLTYAAFEAGIGALKAGNTVGQLREAVLSVVRGTEYESHFRGFGHGMGLNEDIHPTFRPENADFVYQDNMVMSVEVSTIIPGFGLVHYEDNFVVRGDSPLRLSKCDKLVVV